MNNDVMREPLLRIEDLRVNIMAARGAIHAVRGANLCVYPGDIFGLVGESGCGKTITAKSIMRLNNEDSLIYSGRIEFDGRDLLELSEKEMCEVRGSRIGMIFQDPQTALDPLLRVGKQIEEVFRLHGSTKIAAHEESIKMLESVGIHPAEERSRSYPFEMSGGQLQRVMIAMALATKPALLIADEPTTALDVTVQSQILDLLRELQRESGTSVFIITHDFGVIAEMANRVGVMYAGRIVEIGDVSVIFHNPKHPYTRDLIASIPKKGEGKPESIPGSPPDLRELIPGCPYAPRCDSADSRCRSEAPDSIKISDTHECACFMAEAHA